MKAFLYAIRADFVKYFAEFKYYKFNYSLGVVMHLLLFLGITYITGATSQLSNEVFLKIVVGFLLWWYATSIFSEMSLYILEEATLGTLEQVFTALTPFHVFIFSRIIATILRSTFWMITFGAILFVIFPNKFHWPQVNAFAFTLIIVLSLLTAIGLGFVLLGLSLLYKRMGALLGLIEYILLFFSGIFFALPSYPFGVRIIVYILPLSWGIENLRLLLVEGIPLSKLMIMSPMFFLLLSTMSYIFLGIGVYRVCLKKAMTQGKLAHY